MRCLPLILLAGLAACAEFPALDATLDAAARDAPYPALQPLDPLLAQGAALAESGRNSPAALASVQGRIAALQARAAGLRGPVIDAATRDRMRRGVAAPTQAG